MYKFLRISKLAKFLDGVKQGLSFSGAHLSVLLGVVSVRVVNVLDKDLSGTGHILVQLEQFTLGPRVIRLGVGHPAVPVEGAQLLNDHPAQGED